MTTRKRTTKTAPAEAILDSAIDDSAFESAENLSQVEEPSSGQVVAERVSRYLTTVTKGPDSDAKIAISEMAKVLIDGHSIAQKYHIVCLLEPANSIDDTDLNRVYTALRKMEPRSSKDVMLLILSRGGSIEPAYQISKLCKAYSKQKFVVVVPRHAKSAATLIALGADEIHIGELGQLGPIDPQLGGLPALGVGQAIQSFGRLAEEFPGSSEMIALYLRGVLTIEQIGYCDRIAESAVQYAQRLLSTKSFISSDRALAISKKLVHEYKDHGFVIDSGEATTVLGTEWIFTDSPELDLAEAIYGFFDQTNGFLRMRSKKLLVLGDFDGGLMILKTS